MRLSLFSTTVCGVSAVALLSIAGVAADEKNSQGPPTKTLEEIVLEQPTAGEPASKRPFDGVSKETIEGWKKKYAFQSLGKRLAYEKSAERPAPKLGVQAAARIEQVEKENEIYRRSDRRAQSLALLHDKNVDQFVSSPGFGISRIPMPGPSYFQEEPETPIPLARVAPLSDGDASLSVTAPLAADATAAVSAANRWKMPPADEVAGYHQNMAAVFAWYDRNGYFKNIDQVAGFKPHAIVWAQPTPVNFAVVPAGDKNLVAQADEAKRWKVARMELVSLLKHETPRVYLSENLPRMDELSSVKTRAVTSFETAGLEKLVAGDDLHTASTPNRIEMVGSLRATKQCTQCHQVPRGTLLGAFSYELRRDPPMAVEKEKVAPLQ